MNCRKSADEWIGFDWLWMLPVKWLVRGKIQKAKNLCFKRRCFPGRSTLLQFNFPPVKIEINGRGDSLRWPRDTLYPLKLALTSPTSGGSSVGVVRLRTKPRNFLFFKKEEHCCGHEKGRISLH
jgi:hypothetical protein